MKHTFDTEIKTLPVSTYLGRFLFLTCDQTYKVTSKDDEQNRRLGFHLSSTLGEGMIYLPLTRIMDRSLHYKGLSVAQRSYLQEKLLSLNLDDKIISDLIITVQGRVNLARILSKSCL